MLAGHHGNYSRYEIERKYLLKKLPENLPQKFVDIEDTYLPNSSLRLRIEKTQNGEIIGRKSTKKDKDPAKGFATNIITSLYLSKKDLIALNILDGFVIKKRRYIYEDDDTRTVYDEFKENHKGLIVAEVEFKDETACRKYCPSNPDWIEVTGNSDYSGGFLASFKNFT